MRLTTLMRNVICCYANVTEPEFERTERYVNGLMIPLSQEQFDAIVSLGLSIGTTRLGRSAVVRKSQTRQDTRGDFAAWAQKTGDYARRLTELMRWYGATPAFFTDDSPQVVTWRLLVNHPTE